MSRPIEFRAWDKKTNKMYDVASIDMFGAVVTLVERGEDVGVDFIDRPLSEVELRHYTGLLDKNGTKIFEGDILQHYSAGYHFGVFAVKWDDNGFWDYGLSAENSVVIGNIYENKELLNDG